MTRWLTYNLSTVLADARFAGKDGAHTVKGDALPEGAIRFQIAGSAAGPVLSTDRVTAIEVNGVLYTHQNTPGANVHGGNQTTAEWFTVQIVQFRDAQGNRLTDLPAFRKVQSLTPRTPLPAPCFGPLCLVTVKGVFGQVPVRMLEAGQEILTAEGWRKILWTGGRTVEVTERNAPILWAGEVYSPQHRLELHGRWITARQLLKAGHAMLAPHGGTQWYGHILLDGHYRIVMDGTHTAESLLPTERALSGMAPEDAAAIREAMAGHSYVLALPEIKARDLEAA